MQFKTLIVAQLAALAAAAPTVTTTPVANTPAANTPAANTPAATPTTTPGAAVATPSAFNILTLRSGSAIHFSDFNAALSSIFLQLPQPNATCDAASDGAATFSLIDGELYLYSTENPPQKLYADRSGMGQGKLGYVTGAQPAPRNGELTGWGLDDYGNLNIDGAGFLACPGSIDDSWSVWVDAGVSSPGGNTGCLGFSARAIEATEPNSCLYTQ